MKKSNPHLNDIRGDGINRLNMLKALLGGSGAGLLAMPLNAQRQSKLAKAAKTPVPHRLSVSAGQVLWQQRLLSICDNHIVQAAYSNGYCVFMDNSNNVVLTDVQAGLNVAIGYSPSVFGTITPWRNGSFVAQNAAGQLIVSQSAPAANGAAPVLYAPAATPPVPP